VRRDGAFFKSSDGHVWAYLDAMGYVNAECDLEGSMALLSCATASKEVIAALSDPGSCMDEYETYIIVRAHAEIRRLKLQGVKPNERNVVMGNLDIERFKEHNAG
jgi:hypothetical protein